MLPKLRRTLALLAFCFTACASHAQTTRNVGQGQSWSTIQSAIDASNNGDTVLVYPGTYYENIDFKGKAITVTSTPAPSGGPANTIIDGGGKGTAVTFRNREPRSAILTGFTITHGGTTGTGYAYTGDGLYIFQGQPTILNNIITQNYCQNVYLDYSGALLQGNTISSSLNPEKCSVLDSGGIVIWGDYSDVLSFPQTNPVPSQLVGNTIENNTTGKEGDGGGDGGGGIEIWGGQPVILGNILRNNTTGTGSGGAINIVNGENIVIVQNLIYDNSAGCGGGAIGLGNFTTLIVNNTMIDNTGSGRGGYSNCSPSTMVFDWIGDTNSIFVNNIFAGNSADPQFDCTSYEYVFSTFTEANQSIFDHNLFYNAGGSIFDSRGCIDTSAKYGNIVADPQFANYTGHDYHLTKNSPAIDAGNGSALALLKNIKGITLATDFDGNPREQDATGKGYNIIDMGAYEFGGSIDTLPTRVVLSISPTPSQAGNYTLTATLSSGLGVPTGSVTFLIDGQAAGTSNSVGGVATLTNARLTPGVHNLIASYAGQNPFPPAVSVVLIVSIQKYSTTMTITSSANPSVVNQPVTFTIKVASPDPGFIPSPITLTDGSTTLAALTPDSTGTATFTTSSLTLGSHDITASYAGDSAHQSTNAYVYQQIVSGLNTATILTSSLNPSTFGQPVTFTATVATSPSSSSIPTGSIIFADRSTTLATVPLVNGVAAFTTSTLTANDVGSSHDHQITATYSPTGGFTSSIASLSQIVNGLPSAAVLSVTPGSGSTSTTFTLTAAVSSATSASTTVPTGTVVFYSSATNGVLGSEVGFASLVNGVATLTTTGLLGGTDYIVAVYLGDAVYATSTSNYFTLTVAAEPTTLGITGNPNPAIELSPVSIGAVLQDNNHPVLVAGLPVTLVVRPATGGAATTLNLTTNAQGSAGYVTSSLTAGTYYINATFGGNASYLASSSSTYTLTVTPKPTSTVTSSVSPNPSLYGQPTTFTVHVTGTNGSGTPSGTVQLVFCHGAAETLTLDSSGNAAWIVPGAHMVSEPVGSCPYIVSYSGDSTFPAATGGPFDYTVLPAASTTSLSVSPSPGYLQQPTTITVTVTGVQSPVLGPGGQIIPPGAQAASGPVQIFVNGALFGTATLNSSNTAVLTTTALPAGTDTLTAVFPGDANLTGSSSTPVNELIVLPDFTVSAPTPAISIPYLHKGAMQLSFTAINGFNGPVSVGCPVDAPTFLRCEPSAVVLPLNGTATGTLTLDTSGVPNFYGALRPAGRSGQAFASRIAMALLAPLPLAAVFLRRRRRALGRLLLLAFLTAGAGMLSSCAGHYPDGVAPGTYTIRLVATGTSSNVTVPTSHTVDITLTVTK